MNKEGCRVIYITTECNLECTYCYEKRKRDEGFPIKSITDKEIEIYTQSIIDHPDKNVVAILFGGEPFIRPDLLEKTYDYVKEKTLEHGKDVYFDIITNGTLLKQNAKFIKRFLEDKRGDIEISYDGDFSSDRVFPDGTDSKSCVEENLEWMMEMGYSFKMSSVIDQNDPDIVKKLAKISLKYKPTQITFRMKNDYNSNLDKNIRKKLELLFLKTKIPICNITCRVCPKKCGWNEKSNYEYTVPERDEIIKVSVDNRKEGYQFDHF